MARVAFILTILTALASGAVAETGRILVQSTTSTENSGLYAYILPVFEEMTGYDVQVVAVGTGQAIRNAENGDADVLLVHSKDDEVAFVEAGHGVARHDLMYNDFVIIGPADDPAGIANAGTAAEALRSIAAAEALFVSRADDSGTHKKEMSLWADAGIAPAGAWYREIGAGMGAALRMSVETGAYTLSDRATWLAFGGKADAAIKFEGDPPLFNQYGIIVLNPDRHPHVNTKGATAFQDWLLSEDGQSLIASYSVDGNQLFFPNGAP